MKNKMLLIALLSLFSLVTFAAQFEVVKANKLYKAGDWAGLNEYVKANTEYKSEKEAYTAVRSKLQVKGHLTKELNKANAKELALKEADAANLSKDSVVNLLYRLHTCTSEISQKESSAMAKEYYEANINSFQVPPAIMIFAYCNLAEYGKAATIAEKHPGNFFFNKRLTHYVKRFDKNLKIKFAGMVAKNPTDFITKPKDLEKVVEMMGEFTDSKYDALAKELYSKLNKTFYKNISISDDWKNALVKLHLQMKPYGI